MTSHVARPVATRPASPPSTRREPVQRRSRERVERMLESAARLISDQGSDALRMTAVAERAGVSIGSLYQYFPDRSALIRTLAERFNAEGRACVAAEFAAATDAAGVRAAAGRAADGYYQQLLAEPVMRDIWSATQADKSLRDVDLDDVHAFGELLAEAMLRVRPDAEVDQVRRTALVLMQLVAATTRLAIDVERAEGDALIETVKPILAREIFPE